MMAPNKNFWNGFTAILILSIFALAFLESSVAEASSEIRVERYPNHKVHFKVEVDGQQQPHGWSREYTEAGILKAEHHFNHGVRHGISRLYYTTGELMTEWNYRNGKRHGPSFGYFKNGRLKDKGIYQNDLLEGPVLKYYLSGKIKAHLLFKQDRLEGDSVIYFENGEVQHIYRYFKGRIWTREDYSRDGKLLRKQEFPQPSQHP